ncbi:MAG: hypothetical protein JOZ73_11800 [Solirubrobacterales bacterium]|nr:hypothetical protein [Solirubrobacterales bacterium]
MKDMLRRPSPSMVVALIALVVALGGTSYAAFKLPRNSVGTKQIKNRAVTNKKLANGAVTAAKVKNGTLTGNKINSSSLGTVPQASNAANASALGGSPADSYARSAGNEQFHLVGAPGEPGFDSGWANFGSGAQTAGFYKDQFGVVHIRGDVTRNAGTNTTIFTLPPGYLPTAFEHFPVYGNGGTAAGIAIHPDGTVGLVGGNSAFIGLNGITFRTTN